MKRIFTKEEVFGGITALWDKLGMPPTIKELQRHFGIGSTRTILRYLRLLEKDGRIQRYHGARGIFLQKETDLLIALVEKYRLDVRFDKGVGLWFVLFDGAGSNTMRFYGIAGKTWKSAMRKAKRAIDWYSKNTIKKTK